VLWTLMSVRIYEHLVIERRWSVKTYPAELQRWAQRTLIASA